MRRTVLAGLGAMVLLAAFVAPPAVSGAKSPASMDQAAESPGELYRFQLDYGSANYHGLAQTVTVGSDGLLSAVDLFLARESWTAADLEVEIRSNDPSGGVLASAVVPPASIPVIVPDPDGVTYGSGGTWVHITFASPTTVSAGDVIAITTGIPDPIPGGDPAGPAWYWAWSDAGAAEADDYAGGVAWGGWLQYNGPTHWEPWWDGSDLAFRTWVTSAARSRVYHDDFGWGPSDAIAYTNLCPFAVLVSSIGHFRGIERSDKAGNYVATEWFGQERDFFSANGHSLVSDWYQFHLAYRQTNDGVAVQWFGAGPVSRIPLPDGSIFLSAGRVDWLASDHPGFVMVPDVGKIGDMAAFCAALS